MAQTLTTPERKLVALKKVQKKRIDGIDILEFIPDATIEELTDIVVNQENHIRHIRLKKRSGKTRKIVAPSDRYGNILRSLLFNFFKYYRPSDQANGFVLGRSIVDNAKPHVGCNTIINLDLKDFFDNMTFSMANKALAGNKALCQYCSNRFEATAGKCAPSIANVGCKQHNYYEDKSDKAPVADDRNVVENRGNVLFWILHLCTVYDQKRNIRYTPQGFPTSPAISNFIMGIWFDKILNRYCTDHINSLKYTRYADDLTISSQDYLDKNKVREIITKVYKLVSAWKRDGRNKTNLLVNEDKTEVHRGIARKEICGVVVNENLSVRRRKVMEFRAKLHNVLVGKLVDGTRVKTEISRGEIPSVVGMANFLYMVNPKYRTYLDQANMLKERIKEYHV